MALYPNPATGDKVTLGFVMKNAGFARVTVWNASGELAAEAAEYMPVGPGKLTLTVRDYAPGVYLLRAKMVYDSGGGDVYPLKRFVVRH